MPGYIFIYNLMRALIKTRCVEVIPYDFEYSSNNYESGKLMNYFFYLYIPNLFRCGDNF